MKLFAFLEGFIYASFKGQHIAYTYCTLHLQMGCNRPLAMKQMQFYTNMNYARCYNILINIILKRSIDFMTQVCDF